MSTNLPPCEHLLLRRSGPVLHLTFNRPLVRNAINRAMWDEIDEVFRVIEPDRSTKIVVLRGAQGNFSAGGDISERSQLRDSEAKEGVAARNRRGGQIMERIDAAPQAVVAVVEGFALGGGFGLACAADITLADNTARFGMPEVTLGLAPAQILPFVRRRIGSAQLRRIALSAGRLDAAEAWRIGVIHELCESTAQLDVRLAALLAQLDRGAPKAIATAKFLISMAEVLPQEELLDEGAAIFACMAAGPEGIEGAAAFKEKRHAAWQEGSINER